MTEEKKNLDTDEYGWTRIKKKIFFGRGEWYSLKRREFISKTLNEWFI